MSDKFVDMVKLNPIPDMSDFYESARRDMEASLNDTIEATREVGERIRKTQDATIQLAHQSQEQIDLLHQHVDMVTQQNSLLEQNYNTLRQLYKIRDKDFQEAKNELKKSKKFNVIMMIISIIAMLGAVASPIITWLVRL